MSNLICGFRKYLLPSPKPDNIIDPDCLNFGLQLGESMAKSIVGDLVGKRGIVYAPINRAGVLLIFARLLDEFDMLIEETAEDCRYVIVRRRVDLGWERLTVGLACKSSEIKNWTDFQGDMVICWNHDWPDCPVKPFELKSLFDNQSESQTAGISGVQIERKQVFEEDPLAKIMPENSPAVLANRGETHRRFEKAIGDLDEKIKKYFADQT